MKQCFLALILCLLAAADCLAAAIQVRRFDVVIDVSSSGDIVVEETLNVDIPPQGAFHGIYRDIPITTRSHRQGRASLEVIAVRMDGRSLSTQDVSRSPSSIRVYQRDSGSFLAPGMHEFFLSYRMTGQIGLFDVNDELTWNVTGSAWEKPIDEASCTISCPAGAPFFGQKAWLGAEGSMASPVDMSHAVENGRIVMRFSTQRAVQTGEHFTVAAGWGKGFIVPKHTEVAPQGTLLFAFLDAALLLYFFLVWFFIGRDPKKGVIVPRFHPPKVRITSEKESLQTLSPAAMALIYHKNQVTSGCFGAAVLSLALRGCCTIEGSGKEGFVLKRAAGLSPYAEENCILELLKEELPVNREHGEQLAAMRRAMKKQLYRDYGKLWKGAGRGMALIFVGMAAALIALAGIVGYLAGGVLPKGSFGVVIPMLFLLFLFRRIVPASIAFWRSGRWGGFVFSLLFQACALAFMGFFIFMICRDTLDIFTPAETALAFLALLIPLFFSGIMDAPTKEARALLDEIEGLVLYMRMVEPPSSIHAPYMPQCTPGHYHELLPYAVALGLEHAWGAHFSSDLFSASSAGAYIITPERAGEFSSYAERSASSAESSGSSAASASSFGDGGGGAGSGGGGGGGGGC